MLRHAWLKFARRNVLAVATNDIADFLSFLSHSSECLGFHRKNRIVDALAIINYYEKPS